MYYNITIKDLKLKIWSIDYISNSIDSKNNGVHIDLLNSIDYSDLSSPLVDICLYETGEMIGAVTEVGKLIIYKESGKERVIH